MDFGYRATYHNGIDVVKKIKEAPESRQLDHRPQTEKSHIELICLMRQIQCLLFDVSNLRSDIRCLGFDVRCLRSGVWSLMSGV
jgi:hypothetical protein